MLIWGQVLTCDQPALLLCQLDGHQILITCCVSCCVWCVAAVTLNCYPFWYQATWFISSTLMGEVRKNLKAPGEISLCHQGTALFPFRSLFPWNRGKEVEWWRTKLKVKYLDHTTKSNIEKIENASDASVGNSLKRWPHTIPPLT